MYVQRQYDENGKVAHWKVGHTGTGPAQNFRERDVFDGVLGGVMTINGDRLTIKATPEDLRYQILRTPGHYCCHCAERIEGGGDIAEEKDGVRITTAAKHVSDKHAGEASPDKAWPSGYAWLKHFECRLDDAQHKKFKAQPGDVLTLDHATRDLARAGRESGSALRKAALSVALAVALGVAATSHPEALGFPLILGASQVYNISLGRVAELYNRVDTNDPSASVIVVVAIAAGSTSDASFKDFDTLSQSLPGAGGAAEATNSGYARKVLTDADVVAFAPDDTNDRVDIAIPDQTWTAVAAGTNWTDLIIGYDNDSAAGTDANIVPLTLHDFVITPDGSDITADVPTVGFFRAQ